MFTIGGQLIMPQTTVIQLSFQSTSYYSTLSERQPGEGSGTSHNEPYWVMPISLSIPLMYGIS